MKQPEELNLQPMIDQPWDYGLEARLSAGSGAARHDIVTSGGAPFLAQLLNTPVGNKQNARGLGLFIHDEVGCFWQLQ